MADNVKVDESQSLSATDVSADQVTRNGNSEKAQIVKLMYGADGTYDGIVSDSTPLPVKNAPQSGSTSALSSSSSTALEASRLIKATPGRLFKINIYSNKGSAQFIQLHNATSVPSDTAVPVLVLTVAATSNLFIVMPEVYGRYFSNGIVVCNSSTAATKTVGSADCWFDALYL